MPTRPTPGPAADEGLAVFATTERAASPGRSSAGRQPGALIHVARRCPSARFGASPRPGHQNGCRHSLGSNERTPTA